MLNTPFKTLPTTTASTWKQATSIALFLGCVAIGCFLPTPSLQAEETAGKQWPASQQVSMDVINHQSFDQLLKKHVDKNGMVNYKAWHANPTDRQTLTAYLNHLSQANLNTPAQRNAQLAYWINAYNAVTIEGILRVYPTTSIRNHTAKIAGYNIWKDLKLHVGDSKAGLEEIEHKVLRKMNEPRIHFAIVCASIGCPRLLNEAYMPQKMEQQLTINTKDFFSRSQNLQIDTNSRTVKLSKLLNWYGSDFGADINTQLVAYQRYWPEAAAQAVAAGGYRVDYLSYDWNLNAQR